MATGGDDDAIALEFSTFDGDVRLDGGSGTDDFEDIGNNTFNGELKVRNFES